MASRGQPSRLSSTTDQSDKQTSVGQGSPARQSTASGSNREKEQTSRIGNDESLSRRMRLLALRKPRTASALSKTRQKNLEEMKEKEREADLMAARLDSRLEIVNMFLHKSLVDDSFLGRKELNPWLFKNNSNLRDKWNFVHNMVTTQEMLVAIDSAKKRHKAEMEEERERRSADVQQQQPMEKEINKANPVEKARKREQSPAEVKEVKTEMTVQVEIALPVTHESEENDNLQTHDDAERAENNPPEPTENNILTPDVNEEPKNDTLPMKPEVVAPETPQTSPVIVSKPRYRRSPRVKPKTHSIADRHVKCHQGTVKVYAFGSTHRRKCCKYCQGGLRVFADEHSSVVKTSPKTPSGGMNERLDDINGIYVKDPERKSFNEKMQERIHQVEEIMKERVVNFDEHLIKNGYVS